MKEEEKVTELTPNEDWAELTQVCLINIISRLPLEDRWRGAMLVCEAWMQACRDPSLNTVLDLEPYFDSSTESTHWWSPEFEHRIDAILRSVAEWSDGSLLEIRVRHCSDQALVFAARRTQTCLSGKQHGA